ncbi:hypothetical protein G6F37_012172 [Rhizopus arrhizus]|nr:hypothetical protein G6F38_012183 [Rhizopus arrhizus]KAG1145277.1 hypothetical protein G6F37_012172 [Rhizopus arrhizus]
MVGAVGLIPGGGNVFPSLCVELQRLYEKKEFSKAASLQRQIVEADDAACRWYGIAGVKSFIHKKFGYGNGVCRNPLLKVSDQQGAHVESVLDSIVILDQQVFVESINITEVLKRFRKHSIAEDNRNNNLDVGKRVTKHFDNNARRNLKSVASYTKPEINCAPAKAAVYFKNKADEGYDNDNGNDDDGSEEEDEKGEEEKEEEGKK